MFGPVATRDGWINVAVASEKTFQDLTRAAGHPEWMTDPRFALYANRRLNWHLFIEELEGWSRTLSTQEVKACFDRLALPCSLYRTTTEALEDPQLAHRNGLVQAEDAGGGFKALNGPFRFSTMDARAADGTRVASLGEDTERVLCDAGFSESERAALKAAGVTS